MGTAAWLCGSTHQHLCPLGAVDRRFSGPLFLPEFVFRHPGNLPKEAQHVPGRHAQAWFARLALGFKVWFRDDTASAMKPRVLSRWE